jgi:hypothetical protein
MIAYHPFHPPKLDRPSRRVVTSRDLCYFALQPVSVQNAMGSSGLTDLKLPGVLTAAELKARKPNSPAC